MRRAINFLWWFSDFFEFVWCTCEEMPSILSAVTLSIFLEERRLINVISFLIFVFGGNIFPSSKGVSYKKCTEYKRFNITIMDCTHIEQFLGLPDDLSPNIQGLNVSNVRIAWQMKNDTFAKFKDSLLLLDNSFAFPPGFDAFGMYVILSKLQYLDISGGCIYHPYMAYEPVQLFPITLKVLRMNGCSNEYIDISYLISLEELYMYDSGLKRLPTFSIKAPLRVLDLERNNFSSLSPMELVQFCTLQEVKLGSEPGHGLNEPNCYCQCISLMNWLENTIIKSSLSCTSSSSFWTPDCSAADLAEANATAIYDKRCLPPDEWRLWKRRLWKRRWWLILALISLLLLAIALCVIFRPRRNANEEQSEISETVLDEESTTEASVEEGEEELETLEESTDTMTHIGPKAIAEM